jgi:hypothetical protein
MKKIKFILSAVFVMTLAISASAFAQQKPKSVPVPESATKQLAEKLRAAETAKTRAEGSAEAATAAIKVAQADDARTKAAQSDLEAFLYQVMARLGLNPDEYTVAVGPDGVISFQLREPVKVPEKKP